MSACSVMPPRNSGVRLRRKPGVRPLTAYEMANVEPTAAWAPTESEVIAACDTKFRPDADMCISRAHMSDERKVEEGVTLR
jgi:hypothetical protein